MGVVIRPLLLSAKAAVGYGRENSLVGRTQLESSRGPWEAGSEGGWGEKAAAGAVDPGSDLRRVGLQDLSFVCFFSDSTSVRGYREIGG